MGYLNCRILTPKNRLYLPIGFYCAPVSTLRTLCSPVYTTVLPAYTTVFTLCTVAFTLHIQCQYLSHKASINKPRARDTCIITLKGNCVHHVYSMFTVTKEIRKNHGRRSSGIFCKYLSLTLSMVTIRYRY